jgi:hypothetical protein
VFVFQQLYIPRNTFRRRRNLYLICATDDVSYTTLTFHYLTNFPISFADIEFSDCVHTYFKLYLPCQMNHSKKIFRSLFFSFTQIVFIKSYTFYYDLSNYKLYKTLPRPGKFKSLTASFHLISGHHPQEKGTQSEYRPRPTPYPPVSSLFSFNPVAEEEGLTQPTCA